MKTAGRLATVLFLLTLVACSPEETVRLSPTPSPAATTASPAPSPTRTPSPAPTTAAPTASPSATRGGTPSTACPARTGGSTASHVILTDVRVARHPGYDRLVFEFGPGPGPGTYSVPPYTVEVARSFTATSGQPVRIEGNAHFAARFQNTDAHDASGRVTVRSLDIREPTPLIRQVKIVEDFEANVIWGIGLDRLSCPNVLTLTAPVRIVVDFPNGT